VTDDRQTTDHVVGEIAPRIDADLRALTDAHALSPRLQYKL